MPYHLKTKCIHLRTNLTSKQTRTKKTKIVRLIREPRTTKTKSYLKKAQTKPRKVKKTSQTQKIKLFAMNLKSSCLKPYLEVLFKMPLELFQLFPVLLLSSCVILIGAHRMTVALLFLMSFRNMIKYLKIDIMIQLQNVILNAMNFSTLECQYILNGLNKL